MAISILFVHGGPGLDSSYFFPALSSLGGTTYTQKGGASVEDLCLELREKVEALPNQAIVVAHSWGCMLLLETWKRAPLANLKGAVLIAGAFDHTVNEAFERHKNKWNVRENLEKPVTPNDAMRINCLQYVELFFSKDFCALGEKVLGKITYNAASTLFFSDYLARFDLKPVLETINVPLLNLFGANDWRIPAEHSQIASGLTPYVKNHCVANAGHFPFVEQQEECLRVIQDFIAKIG